MSSSPSGQRHCPECGAAVPANAPRCWMCQSPLKGGEEQRPPPGPRHDLAPRGDNPLLIAVGVALLVVAVGSAIDAPGVRVLVLILVMPALIRASKVSHSHSGEGGNVLLD